MCDLNYLFKAAYRPDLRKQRRIERRLNRAVLKSFDEQMTYVLKEFKKVSKKAVKSTVPEDVETILGKLPELLLYTSVIKESSAALLLGGTSRVRRSKLAKIGINFNLSNPLAVEYIEKDKILALAKMSQTTKDELRPVLLEAIKTGQSHQELSATLSNKFLFSKTRAKMIAVHEIGDAYEQGNYIPMQDAQAEGYEVMKKWLTVGDSRVTPSHRQNQGDGWIPLDKTFSGTGDERAPASNNPNCRCTTLFEIKD